jgi:hypothetical protein
LRINSLPLAVQGLTWGIPTLGVASMPSTESPEDRRRLPRAWAKLRVYSRRLLPRELGEMLPTLGSPHPRIPELAVADPAAESESGVLKLLSSNISTGGINATGDLDLLSPRPFAVGEDLVVEIDFPDGEGRLKAIARVMWCSEREDSCRAGLMFVAISEENILRIRNTLLLLGIAPPKGGPLRA